MKVALACGGTGGHIFPGLATAEELRRRGHAVTLWMAGKDVEGTAASGWDGPVVTVPAEGLPRKFSPTLFRAVGRLFRASLACSDRMRSDRPDALLAMGSYASVGPVGAALRCGVPVVLHESNAVPGRAVSFLSRWAAAVAVSFDETPYYLRKRKLVPTGMPLRTALADAARKAPARGMPGRPLTILIMGGSRGARALNRLAVDAMGRARALGVALRVRHLAGLQDVDELRESYTRSGVDARVDGFVHDMAEVYGGTDLAICRSGAATCAELCAFGIPSLLVPLPTAIRDHQTANARALERRGAAQVVPESSLDPGWLATYLQDAVRQPDRLVAMGHAARALARLDAAASLADLVERVGAHRDV